jgi:hypothetical protein
MPTDTQTRPTGATRKPNVDRTGAVLLAFGLLFLLSALAGLIFGWLT